MSAVPTTPASDQRRPLGATGLLVTPLCIGCAPLGDMPEIFSYGVSEEQALATIRAIFDSPINFLDTAASYGDGESERRIGMVLRERGGVPVGFIVATKVDRDGATQDFSGPQMRRSIERSMRLLGMERFPLVYLHDPETIAPTSQAAFEGAMQPGGVVETLRQLQREGVIEHLGIAGGPVDMLTSFVETGVFAAAISHNRYTLLDQEASPFWDVCVRMGVACVNAAPYGSGILAKGPSAYPRFMYAQASDAFLARAHAMEAACARHNVPLAAAALQFSLRDPRIASTVVGVTKPERIQQTLTLAQHPIPAALWAELAAI